MKSLKSRHMFWRTPLLFFATVFVLSACTTLPRENAAAKSEYKSAVTSCSELTGVEHSMCIQDANAEMDSTVASVHEKALHSAEADYKAAVMACKEQPVDARNDCFKTADATRAAAIARAQNARRATISAEKKSVAE